VTTEEPSVITEPKRALLEAGITNGYRLLLVFRGTDGVTELPMLRAAGRSMRIT